MGEHQESFIRTVFIEEVVGFQFPVLWRFTFPSLCSAAVVDVLFKRVCVEAIGAYLSFCLFVRFHLFWILVHLTHRPILHIAADIYK
jgi:hypothetical protein